jgi:hypothetical protein
MGKATKDRPQHSASLAAQLQNGKEPLVSKSKRAKRKQVAEDAEENSGERVVKVSRQIRKMAREQQDEEELEREDISEEEEEEMKWRENQYSAAVFRLMEGTRTWMRIPRSIPTRKSTMRNMTPTK